MKKTLLILIFLSSLVINNHVSVASSALAEIGDNDSCIAESSLIAKLVGNIASFGLFTAYSLTFDMRNAEGNWCNIPTTDIKYRHYNIFGGYDETTLENGDWDYWTIPAPAFIKARNKSDKICVDFLTMLGYQSIGCKYRPDESIPCLKGSRGECISKIDNKVSNCMVGKSCSNKAASNSYALLTITGGVVQCVRDSIDSIFERDSGCNGSVNLFPKFQENMRQIIRILLTIYVIIFGIKIALGGDMPSKGEFIIFVAKLILVMYFSIGINQDKTGVEQLRDGFSTATISLSSMMYNAGGSKNLCNYSDLQYKDNTNYLSIFDSIDCRIINYLGIDLNLENLAVKSITFFSMLFPALNSFQLIFFVICLIFLIFFISICVFFTYFYLIALILQAILIYFAPIFVPFALFGFTKGYFDGWLRQIISYTLQPMIVTTFIGLMLTLFDQVIYTNCEFEKRTTKIFNRKIDGAPYWIIKLPSKDPQKCKDSWGWHFHSAKGDLLEDITLVFFRVTILKPKVVYNLFTGLLTLILFSAIFLGFTVMLTGFVADLVGGTDLGKIAGDPMATAKKGLSIANKIKKYKEKGNDDKENKSEGSGAEMKKRAGGGNGTEVGKGASEAVGKAAKEVGESL